MGGNRKKNNRQPVTWAQSFRDVTNKAMDKGQLIPILVGFIVLLSILGMDSQQLFHLWNRVLDGFLSGNIFLWLLILILLLVWRQQSKGTRQFFSEEYKRMGTEKSKLQKQLSPVPLKSSDSVE